MFDINAVVVGAGFIGPVHVEALRRAGVNVLGVLGVDEAETRRAAKNQGIPNAYKDYQEILADRQVHSIHLAVPNRLHFAMARDAIKAGKSVLCEKPLAMNARESAELVALAGKCKLAAGVNYNLRYYPMALEAKDMVRRGEIGEVYHVAGSYVQDWLLYPNDYNWRVLAEEGGQLRAVSDIGTHWLDMVRNITGLEVESLCADLKVVHPVRQRPKGEVETFTGKEKKIAATEPVNITTDDYGCIMLRFRGGARGVMWVSQVTAGRKNCLRFEIAGARKALAWDGEKPNELWIGYREKANEVLLRDPSLVSPTVRPFVSYPGGHNEGFADACKNCFRDFYGYIAAGDFSAPPTYPTFADGHREIVLCDAIVESHRKSCWVNV